MLRSASAEGAGSPGALGASDLAEMAGMIERPLRRALAGPRWDAIEAQLAAPEFQPDTANNALRRYVLLRYHQAREQERQHDAEHVGDEVRQEAARDLLVSRPVSVALESGRVVRVTGRSVNAVHAILAHGQRVALLKLQLQYAAARVGEEQARAGLLPWIRRRRCLRRLRRWTEVHERLCAEMMAHRHAMLRHVFTPSGAASADDDPGPPWLGEITATDEIAIGTALIEVGPARFARLGPPPPQKHAGGAPAEDFGIMQAVAAWGLRMKVGAAEMADHDIGAVLTEMRLASVPSLEEELEG